MFGDDVYAKVVVGCKWKQEDKNEFFLWNEIVFDLDLKGLLELLSLYI